MLKIDLSLKNAPLYHGCEIGEVGGRDTLLTEPVEASNIVGRNAIAMIEATPADQEMWSSSLARWPCGHTWWFSTRSSTNSARSSMTTGEAGG